MKKFLLVGVISTLSLSACGGGSSSSSKAPLIPKTEDCIASSCGGGSPSLPQASAIPKAEPCITASCGGGSTPLPKPPQIQKTENCITSSYGWTSDSVSPTDNFVLPNQADIAIFKTTGFTCARIPIGSGSVQEVMYIAEANAYHAAGITVQGVISSADINDLPSSSIFSVSDEIEAGNELDVAPAYSASLAIAYTKAVAIAGRAANPHIKIISSGVTRLDFLSQTIPFLTNVIDCIGIHPYGMNPVDFGSIAANIRNAYGLPVCFTEWGNTPGNFLTPEQVWQGYNSSQGVAAEFNYFNLGQLEANVNELNVL
jgi:hypothetical protein